jgi:uncharacterized protein YqgC (DUF456 family)
MGALVVLGAVLFGALLLVPLGLPGTWVMIAAAVGYNALTGTEAIGTFSLVVVLLLAAAAEWAEFVLGARYARRYGGSRRAGWGAILGGLAGTFMGVPVPIVGPVIGALVGSFAGALLFEYSAVRDPRGATRVATGALVGRVVAIALKSAVGCMLLVWILLAAGL